MEAITPFWNILGALWIPVILAAAAAFYFMTSVGGLLGVIMHGVKHVGQFSFDFLARTGALALLVALVLIAGIVFKAVGAPSIAQFFPNPLAAQKAPAATTANAQVTGTP